jgi:hypothetical protein
MENSIEIPQKIKAELSYDAAILPLGMYPKEMNALYQKNTCSPMFIIGLFITVKIWINLDAHQ